MNASNDCPLAIIGIGCLFPHSPGARAYWANIKNAVDCIGPIPSTHWKVEDYFDVDPKSPDHTYAKRGGFLEPIDFNPVEFGIAPNDIEATDTSQLLGLVAARQALRDAGYWGEKPFDKNRVSVILGVTGTLELVIPLGARLGHPHWRRALKAAGVADDVAQDVVDRIADAYVPWQENSFPGLLGNVVAGRIANRLDLGGTNCVVDAACASSLSAIHLAGLELAAGRSDLVVTGGVDTFNDIFMYMCFSKTPALSPSGDAKPFEAKGDGTILGEGLGIVVLKRLADAERDGDRVYAVIQSLGSSSDGKGNAIYAPVAAGQTKALRKAYELAGISPSSIELVEGHGTGTKVGDAVEASALVEVYREAQPQGTWCALGSVKSQIGHTKAAAGAAGLIKAALALYHKVLPPSVKVTEPLPVLAPGATPFYVNTLKRPWVPNPEHPRRAAVSAFGFGGSNFHCVLEEHQATKAAPDWDGAVEILALCGESTAAIDAMIRSWPDSMTWEAFGDFAATTRSAFRGDAPVRRLWVVSREGFNWSEVKSGTKAIHGAGSPPRLAVLFPGQGSQTVGMLRDLACQFPAFLDVLAQANEDFPPLEDGEHRWRLSDLIYPHPAFTPEVKARQEATLRATEIAQPAVGAVSLGAWAVLSGFGVRADAFAGHSYGELVALHAAGSIDADALHTLSRLRGEFMLAHARRSDDPGSMLAILEPLERIEATLREENLNLVIANKNAPLQTVLSGSTPEIERAERVFGRRRMRAVRIPVAAAFHSLAVAGASADFRAALDQSGWHPPRLPVYSNTTASPYPSTVDAAKDLLAGQLAAPVEFVRQIQRMINDGLRSFVEVGPGTTLTRLVDAIAKAMGENVTTLALDASAGKKSGIDDLAQLVARLAAAGHAVDLTLWESPRPKSEVPTRKGMTVPLSGANYVKPRPQRPARPKAEERPPMLPSKAVDRPAAPLVQPKEPVRPVVAPALPAASPPPPAAVKNTVDPNALNDALQVTQQSLAAVQKLQEQTAQLHRQFLDHQQSAQVTLQTLIEQQHAILFGGGTPAIAPRPVAPTPVVAPAPVPPPTIVAHAPARVATPVPQPTVAPTPSPVRVPEVKPRVEAPPVIPPAVNGKHKNPVDSTRIRDVLLGVVSEKTGYPVEMLELDMTLDSDLGIDSIKRVEILSALQEKLPEAPVVKPEHLGTLLTLRQIVEFLQGGENAPASTPVLQSASTARTAPGAAVDGTRIRDVLLGVVSEKTGYPVEMLELDMTLDSDLGIDSIKRVEILSALQEKLPEAPVVKPEHLGTLLTLRQIVEFLQGEGERAAPAAIDPPSPVAESIPAPLKKQVQPEPSPSHLPRQVLRAMPLDLDRPRESVMPAPGSDIWIVNAPSELSSFLARALTARGYRARFWEWNKAPTSSDGLGGLIIVASPDDADPDLPLKALHWLQRAHSIRHESSVLATVTWLDGKFGLGNLTSDRDPTMGALAGLAKTVGHEWPNVKVKAFDIDPTWTSHSAMAEVILDELFIDGPTEVGLTADGRWSLELAEVLVTPGPSPIESGDVVLITGGARGVTFEAAMALARTSQPTLILMGRTAMPDEEPEWLTALSDETEIKRAIRTRLNGDTSPRAINEHYQRIAAQREIRQNLESLTQAGALAEYITVDVQDAFAVRSVIVDIERKYGPVAVVVHGAGVLADRHIEDLTVEQFHRVYGTKVEGLRNVLESIANLGGVKAMAFFSSSTARFGRKGQLAYAMANEVLNKIAQQYSRRLPNARVVAINWGPWEGGMVTPGLRKLFESEGVGLIPLAAGGAFLQTELSASDGAAEVVCVAQSAPVGGQPTVIVDVPVATDFRVAFERDIDLSSHPILSAHVVDGKAVFPLALHLEWLGHAAMHYHPGFTFQGVDDLRVVQPIRLHDSASLRIQALAGKASKQDGLVMVPVELRGRTGNEPVVYSRARVVLANASPVIEGTGRVPSTQPYPRSLDECYQSLLFHGVDLQGIEEVRGVAQSAIVGIVRTAPAPRYWFKQPLRSSWLADPLVLDSAFQMMILWGFHQHNSGSLPISIGSYRQYRRAFPSTPLEVVARITRNAGGMGRADIDFIDAAGQLIARIKDYDFVFDLSLNEAFRRNLPATPVRA